MADQKYSKLLKKNEYDKGAAEEFADALNEIMVLEQRIAELSQLLQENHELKEFIWCTAERVHIAFHKIEDDHLRNILNHLNEMGRPLPGALRREAVERGIPIPNGLRLADGGRNDRLRTNYQLLANTGLDSDGLPF